MNYILGDSPLTLGNHHGKMDGGNSYSIEKEVKNEVELIAFSEKTRKKLSTFGVNTGFGFSEAIKGTYRRTKIELGKLDRLQSNSDDFDKIIFLQFSRVFLSYLKVDGFSIIGNKEIVREVYNDFREFILSH